MAWQSRLPLVALLAALLSVTSISQGNSGEAFYAAIRADDLPRLNGLLSAGADVNAKDERGVTPLMYTAWVGSVDAMKQLLDHGADPNLSNSSGSTALMLSATQIAKVRLLRDRGAKVNATRPSPAGASRKSTPRSSRKGTSARVSGWLMTTS